MKKIFKLFTVLMALFMLVGLTGCFFFNTPEPSDPTEMNIDSAEKLVAFLSNGSGLGTLTTNIDLYETASIPAGTETAKTLDLAGYSIAYRKETTGPAIRNIGGTLTIQDSSEGKTGKIQNFCNIGGSYAVSVIEGGTLTLSSSTFKAEQTAVYVGTAQNSTNGGTATIAGGTNVVISGECGLGIDEHATVTDLCCTIDAGERAIVNFGTISKISGGSYSAYGDTDNDVYGILNFGTISNIVTCMISATNDGNGDAVGIMKMTGSTISQSTLDVDNNITAEVTGSGTAYKIAQEQ